MGHVTDEPRGRLADAASAWRRRQKLTLAQVARHSGLSVNTIRYILDGTTRRPVERTLAALARGLTTDPEPPYARDPQDEAECLRDLRAAGGYATLDEIEDGTLLELGLWIVLRNRRKVRAWLAAIGRLADRSADEIDALGGPDEPP